MSGKDDTEEESDVDLSMYPLLAFFDLFCLFCFEFVVDVEDSDAAIDFFDRFVRLLLLLAISGDSVSISVPGSNASRPASIFLMIGFVKGIWGNSITDFISPGTSSIALRHTSKTLFKGPAVCSCKESRIPIILLCSIFTYLSTLKPGQ